MTGTRGGQVEGAQLAAGAENTEVIVSRASPMTRLGDVAYADNAGRPGQPRTRR